MNKYKVKVLTEVAICTAVSVMAVLLGIRVPMLSALMTLLAGVPMMYLGMRRGVKVLAVLFPVCLSAIFPVTQNVGATLLLGGINFLPGMVMGYALRKRYSFATIIFAGSGVLLLGLVCQLALFNAMADGQGIANLVNQAISGARQSVHETLAGMQEQLSVQGQDVEAILNQTMDAIRDIIFLYLPSFLIGSSVVMSYLLFMLGCFLLHRTRPVRIIYLPFWGICASRATCYLAAVLYLITSFSTDTTVWTAALQNIQVLLYGYLAVCGMSFLDYKFKKKIPSGYGRAIIYFAVFCVGYLLLGMLFQGLCILGMIEGMLGFRMREERVRHE